MTRTAHSSLTPTYTPPITDQSRQRAFLGSPPLTGKDISLLVPPSAGDWRVFQAFGYAFSSTYTAYTDLHPFCQCSDRLPRITKSHLSHSQPAQRSYPLSIQQLSPTQPQYPAGISSSRPTLTSSVLSFILLQPLTGTYSLLPGATHTLTPLFKGVSVRGVASHYCKVAFLRGWRQHFFAVLATRAAKIIHLPEPAHDT